MSGSSVKLQGFRIPLLLLGSNVGITLVCLEDATIVFEPDFNFVPTYDYSKEGVTAVFDREGFSMAPADGDFEEFNWGVAYPYKEIPTMKAWLVQQQMQLT